ncbi:Hypothetical protein FKW44_016906, partial [Caligus rogercresseyi]
MTVKELMDRSSLRILNYAVACRLDNSLVTIYIGIFGRRHECQDQLGEDQSTLPTTSHYGTHVVICAERSRMNCKALLKNYVGP